MNNSKYFDIAIQTLREPNIGDLERYLIAKVEDNLHGKKTRVLASVGSVGHVNALILSRSLDFVVVGV